jgi:hypothetical protein
MTTKKKQQTAGPLQYDTEYDSFVQGLQLVGLGMKSCRGDLDREALFASKETAKIFVHKYRLTDFSDKAFDAEGNFELAISESEEAAPAVKMECVFEVHFHGHGAILREHAERFVGSELRLILVPLARQFFFSLSGQMAIAPVVVPLTTRFSKKSKKKLPSPE